MHASQGSYRDLGGGRDIIRRKQQVETEMEPKLSGPPVGFPGREEDAGTFCACTCRPLRAVVVVKKKKKVIVTFK